MYWDTDPLVALTLNMHTMVFPTALSGLKGEQCWPRSCSQWTGIDMFYLAVNLSKRKTGLQKLAYDQFMSSHFNLNFTIYLEERLEHMFAPYVLGWDNIHFENSLAALKPFSTGNVMQIIKIWLNGWTTTSRIKGGHDVYPCFFGCHGCRDDRHHYIICPMFSPVQIFE